MAHTPTGKPELVSVVCENLYIFLDKLIPVWYEMTIVGMKAYPRGALSLRYHTRGALGLRYHVPYHILLTLLPYYALLSLERMPRHIPTGAVEPVDRDDGLDVQSHDDKGTEETPAR